MGYTRAVVQVKPDGTRTLFRSIKEAARKTYSSPGSIKRCCSGELDESCGYKWEFCNDVESSYVGAQKAVIILHSDGKIERYNSMSDAERSLGLRMTCISKAINYSGGKLPKGRMAFKVSDLSENELNKLYERCKNA